MRTMFLAASLACGTPSLAQYPAAIHPLPDSQEISLARSAAPPAISNKADVYAVAVGGIRRLVAGTNGCACIVNRDLHAGSAYPHCYDREAVRTVFPRNLKEQLLLAQGRSAHDVQRLLDSLGVAGEFEVPVRPAVTWMMSPLQRLFTSPFEDGRPVGAWHPHLMIYAASVGAAQLGLSAATSISVMSVGDAGTPWAHLDILVPEWSDGTSAPAPKRAMTGIRGASAAP
jgi:hypothetical protein